MNARKNKTLTLSFEEAITLLSELETLLISLANIGRHYHHETTPLNEQANIQYALETTRFIDEYNITNTLAQMRKMISEKFDNSIGTDDMGTLNEQFKTSKLGKNQATS
ncbi:hypothetical protein [Pseudomonas urmiensis]|uniref:hypothetical protein n=1 Tax=Pseudomonas urmiensis TaxID=2745493 RepID=UPI001CEDDBD0|nr:hypothetical protein [Pseudomonas urmiensis]